MTTFDELHGGTPSSEFARNRELATAKREALEELCDTIEGVGYNAYVTAFDEHTDEDRLDNTFEVRFVVGLGDSRPSEGGTGDE